jgi:ADP-ribose pyrophosphatase
MHEATLSSETVFKGRIFDVERIHISLADGTRSVRDVIRHSGAVGVLAEQPDGRFVFVRQYRKAQERVLLEIVAGTLKRGEDPRLCAGRELEEETGWRAGELISLGPVLPSPGYVDERIELFYARLAGEAGAQALDPDERVEPVALTRAEVEAAIDAGTLCDAKSIAAWHLYLRKVARA